MKKILQLTSCLLLALAAGASASSDDSAASSTLTEDDVRERSRAYLEAMRLNDLATAYAMELGAVDGTLTPLLFRQRAVGAGRAVREYEIQTVEVDGDIAVVEAKVTYRYPQLLKPYETLEQFEWVARDGELYCRISPVTPEGTDSGAAAGGLLAPTAEE